MKHKKLFIITSPKSDSVKINFTDVFISRKNENSLELDFRFENLSDMQFQ